MPRRWIRRRRTSLAAVQSFRSHRLEGNESRPHARQRETSLFGKPTFGGPTETKKARSVVALSRVPRLARYAGSPPAAGLSKGRLTGLLSGSPPTDTRPQARAIWARHRLCESKRFTSVFFARGRNFWLHKSFTKKPDALLPRESGKGDPQRQDGGEAALQDRFARSYPCAAPGPCSAGGKASQFSSGPQAGSEA